MNTSAYKKIDERTENKDTDEESAGFVIKKQRNQEQIRISQCDFLIDKSKHKISYSKKYPEICLGKNQRKIFRKRKNVKQPIHSMFYNGSTVLLYFYEWISPRHQSKHP